MLLITVDTHYLENLREEKIRTLAFFTLYELEIARSKFLETED